MATENWKVRIEVNSTNCPYRKEHFMLRENQKLPLCMDPKTAKLFHCSYLRCPCKKKE